MTIKISQLGAVATLQGNTIIPMVSNLTGMLTTVQANMTQISNFITGGSSGGYGNIVPSANLTYSLGSPTQWWKDLYVSSNTIYVGGTALSVSDGTLSLDGYAVAGKEAATTPVGTAAGTYWHYANSGLVTDQIRTSAYGAGKFVAWLTGGTGSPGYFPNAAIYSSDGINWTQTSTPNVAQTSQQITFGGNKFVAIYTTTGNTATSTDGITWTFNQDVIPAYGVYGYEFYKNLVAYGNGRFVALTGYTTRRSVISTDGVNWSNGAMSTGSVNDLPATDRQGESLLYQSLAFTSGVFVASATRVNGSGGNLIAYTTDGVTWGNIQLPWGHDLTSGYILGAGGGAFVGVPNASGNVGIRSTDGGRTWSNISLPEPFTYTSVLYGNGQFILLSADASTNIAISSDGGVTWSEVNTPYNSYYSGAYGDNTFIATGIIAGNVFNISYSTAGVDATPIGATTPSTARFTNATITNDLVVSGDITGPTITDLYANVIAANTGMKGYVDSVSGSESIANVNMKVYVDGQVTAANAGVTAANIGMVGYVNSQVTAANISANTANIAMVGYVNTQVTTANVGMKGYVDAAVVSVGGSTYGNANVAQFLPTYSGNIGSLLNVGNFTVFGNITAGFAIPIVNYANVIFLGTGTANGYSQLNIQNIDSTGTQTSADFIATAPNGTDSTYYIDMGINGNNYSSSSWTISGANDGYVYINQGNLTLGTDTPGKTVKVHVGGTLTANVVSIFESNGLSVAGNVTGTYFIGDGSQLTNLPGVGSYSNVQVATYLPTYSGNIAANIAKAGYIWSFGSDGNLTLPRQLFLPNGAAVKDTPGDAVGLGNGAGFNTQGDQAVAIGREAGETTQGARAVAVGVRAGQNSQGISAVAIGDTAGNVSQGNYATAVGINAGRSTQGLNATAVGNGAGETNQGVDTVAVGVAAGGNAQSSYATAVGVNAGQTGQGLNATAIGNGAGQTTQGADAVAVGVAAGNNGQGAFTVAIGSQAGQTSQGNYAIAIGYQAGATNQSANSIAINSSLSMLYANVSGLFINPVRQDDSNIANVVYYNTTSKEMTYGPAAGSSYSNVQVATYLPTYSGNIANITLGASGEIAFNQSSYIIETDIVDGNLTPTGYHSLSLNSSSNGILVLNALDSNSAVSSSVTVANTSAQINVNNQIWTFGDDGNLTLPVTGQIQGSVDFTMANIIHWTSNVYNVSDALNQLAERIWNIENP